MKKNISSLLRISLVLVTFIVYSLSSVFSKNASMYPFASKWYVVNLCLVLMALGTYAALWQKVLSFMPLNRAFLFKSITIVLILGISAIVFSETITITNLIGTAFIMLGLLVLSWEK